MRTVYQNIGRALGGRVVQYALSAMRPWVSELENDGFTARWEMLRDSYERISDFFLSGEQDSQRDVVLDKVVHDTYVLLDDVYLSKMLASEKSYEVEQLLHVGGLTPVVEDRNSVEGPKQVFRFFWLTPHPTEEDFQVLMGYVRDEEMEEEAMMGVSGLTLSLLRCFDEKSMLCLMQCCADNTLLSVRERAWVGVMLVLMQYDRRVMFFPNVLEQLQDMLETDDGSTWAMTAITCLLRTLATEWVGSSYKSLHDKLLPLIEKYVSEDKFPKQDGKIVVDLTDPEVLEGEAGDEFVSVIEEQRHQLEQFRDECLDTDYAMYSGMYHTPFFSSPMAWLLPYDEDFLPDDNALQLSRNIRNAPSLADICDADRYAFVTTMSTPEMEKVNLMSQISAEPGEESEDDNNDSPSHLLCHNYARQFYRLYRLNPWGIETGFASLLRFANLHILPILIPDSNTRMLIAKLLINYRAYEQAAMLYDRYADSVNTADGYRHGGLAYHKQKMYEQAVAYYRHSLAMETNEWTLRQLVSCYRAMGSNDQVLEQLDKLLALFPDNLTYLYEKGQCLEKLELYAEALPIYYQVLVSEPENEHVIRAIAWCDFLCEDYEECDRYFRKLLPLNHADDLMHYGHLLFVRGQRREALNYYQKAREQHASLKAFLQSFRPERQLLLEKGVPRSDVYMMEDQLMR